MRIFYIFGYLITLTVCLPPGFVYLEDVDPTIIQSVRYYSYENFMGRIVNGYVLPKVVLTA